MSRRVVSIVGPLSPVVHPRRSGVRMTLHVAILLCVLALAGASYGASNLAGTNSGKHAKKRDAVASQPAQQSAPEQLGTERTPLFVKSIPGSLSEADAAHKEYEYHDKPLLDRWLTWGTVALATFTFFLFCFTAALWWVTYRLSRDAKASGETQDINMRESLRIASESVQSANAQAQSIVAAERAYVKLSHLPPGLKFGPGFGEVTMEIKNWGKTPADVTDVVVGYKLLDYGEKLPMPYPLDSADRESFPNAFLVSGESFFITKNLSKRQVVTSDKQLWVFGHVDYIDVFGQRWRGGYARKYVDDRDNNLVYNTESRDNFDRKRELGEGNDWSTSTPTYPDNG